MKGKGILQSYVVAEEGQSRPKTLNDDENSILTWTKAIIHRLKDKLQKGIKFFIDHGDGTNSHDGRTPVGEIISSFIKNIKGKLSNIVIGHFPDEHKVKNKDMCSMEAEINTYGNIVDDIEEISGIALGNTKYADPAFIGARKLNTVQCFNTIEKGDINMAEESKKISFDDIKKAVKDMNIFAWQLYSKEDLENDKVFGKVFEQNKIQETEITRLKKELETTIDKNNEAIKEFNKAEAIKKLDSFLQEGFTDKQKKYIKSRFNLDKLENLSDEHLKKYIDEEKNNFAEDAKFFGAEVENESSSDPNNTGTSSDSSSKLSPEEEALQIIGV
ncbi:MAG: hypothetical protein P8Y70_00055 [Candidatus Lokiarchaeota archaeon]